MIPSFFKAFQKLSDIISDAIHKIISLSIVHVYYALSEVFDKFQKYYSYTLLCVQKFTFQNKSTPLKLYI